MLINPPRILKIGFGTYLEHSMVMNLFHHLPTVILSLFSQLFRYARGKTLFKSAVFIFVTFSGPVQTLANHKCSEVFRDQALAKHFVEVLDGEFKLGFDWKPRKNAKNKTIFLDGLSLSFPHSQKFANAARQKGVSLVRVDMVGTGNSLKNQVDEKGFFGRDNKIPADLQAQAVASFIEQISTNPVNLVGLSYGGGIAALVAQIRPDLVKNLIMVNPYVVDIGDLKTGGLQLFTQWNPFLRSMIENQRNSVLSSSFEKFRPNYLADNEDVYFDSLHQLTEGIRPYDLREILSTVTVSSHLLTGAEDKFIDSELYEQSFDALPEDSRGNFTELEGGPHDLLSVNPDFIAQWLADTFPE